MLLISGNRLHKIHRNTADIVMTPERPYIYHIPAFLSLALRISIEILLNFHFSSIVITNKSISVIKNKLLK